MKICVDPGHGHSNKKPGVYDPGACHGGLEEADIAMDWAESLENALTERGIQTFRTRNNRNEPTPVWRRAEMAKETGCTHLISIHVNDTDNALAHGTETLYRDDDLFASRIHSALMAGLRLRDRGIKQRNDLAVLKFSGQSALIELGFIKHPGDVAAITDPEIIAETCKLIAETLN